MSADEGDRTRNLSRRKILLASTTLAAASALGAATPVSTARAQQSAASGKQPNILVIMGDDIGWFNIGAYHQGIMSGKTPNLDKLAAEGIRFTDYYAEASCTAGRANFITGQIPLRTGLTTVGQAGADVGMPDQSVTTALILKSMGYATGQFGKNHLGDLNKYLPTLHGFDEFFGYLVPPRRDVRSVLVRLPAGLDRQIRTAQSRSFIRDRDRRPYGDAALGQDRQTAHCR